MHTSRRDLFRMALAGAPAGAAWAQQKAREPEWRNKQANMSYRRFGRTGMMISEVVSGGDPIRSSNWQHLELALDLGLNYLDMAPAYGRGDCEAAYGKLLGGSPSKRAKVFLTTKVSLYRDLRGRMYKDIFNGLPGDKQAAILKRVEEIRRESIGEQPGYFVEYYPGQGSQFAPMYLGNAMAPEYSEKVEGSPEFRKAIRESIEGSLKRVGTDYFDVLMCPHGACSAKELENPYVYEMFLGLRSAGKVRFLGVTSHNDPAGVLRKAAQLGWYDVAMVAYNVINGGYMEQAIMNAVGRGMGVLAMKTAHAVATHHKALQPIPEWRVAKVNRIVPGEMKPALKGYLWALQNPYIAGVISNLWDENYVRENLGLAGKKVKLQPA